MPERDHLTAVSDTTPRPPTPADAAAQMRRIAENATARAGAAALAPLLTRLSRPVWSRTRFEAVLLSDASGLHPNARLLGLVLARHASPTTGHIEQPPSQLQLVDATGLARKQVLVSRTALAEQGWLRMAPRQSVSHGVARPLTLTIPPARRAS